MAHRQALFRWHVAPQETLDNSSQVLGMNKFFKSIWSDALGAWVATSEKSPARGKRSGRVARGVAAMVLMVGAGSASATFIPGTMNGINEFAMGNGSVANANSDPSGLNAALALGSMTQALGN
jgi:trimeric autotransporter adhesin